MDLLNDFGFNLLRQFPKNTCVNLSPVALLQTAGLLDNNHKLLGSNASHDSLKKTVHDTLTADSEYFHASITSGVCCTQGNEAKQKDVLESFQGKDGVSSANNLIKKHSKDRVKELIHSDGNKTILFNFLYVEAKYCQVFHPESTEEGEYHVDAKTTIKVPFLKSGGLVMFNEDKEIGVRMMLHSFNGCTYEIAVLVPSKKFGLDDVERGMTGARLKKLLENTRSVLGSISFPRLSLETSTNITEELVKAGLDKSSVEKSNLFKHDQTKIDSIMHGISLNFNEFGCNLPKRELTEREQYPECCGGFTEQPEEQDVRADQPFLLAIVMNHREKGRSLVSLSRVVKPIIH